VLDDAAAVQAAVAEAIGAFDRAAAAARAVHDAAVAAEVAALLRGLPIERLRDTTDGRLAIRPLQDAGLHTVLDPLQWGETRLEALHGVGPETARRAVAAARALEGAARDTVRVRFDVVARPETHRVLLAALVRLTEARAVRDDLVEPGTVLARRLAGLAPTAAKARSRLGLFFTRRATRTAARDALDALAAELDGARANGLVERIEAGLRRVRAADPAPDELWSRYQADVVRFNGLLGEIGGVQTDGAAAHGHLPAEIAARVQQLTLDTSALRDVSLRGYQVFGAKFAVVQRRVMVGDEMGLGKTVEAIAAIGHLWAGGARHVLVVCPAGVVVNWINELRRFATFPARRLHGPGLRGELDDWLAAGGVAVTTFQTLQTFEVPSTVPLAMVVVDEAHYVKNPEARRTTAVAAVAARAERVLFLSGTPLENRVDEFRSLIGHLDPGLARSLDTADGLVGANRFRTAVAPVYLRRTQADVLDELPDLVETEQWVTLEGPDERAYRDAVASGNFMAMRQAAFAPGTIEGSAKLERLMDIVEESVDNGRKVVVFSYFHAVLDCVHRALGPLAVGDPLVGATSPDRRQQLIDRFGAAPPSVLVSQIEAGGVGLNIQTASVVVLTEPQWKPSTEAQAIARCHRMGQARTVDVHRLLAEDSVDAHLLEVLGRKRRLIDRYVPSELTRASPDAVDVSDHEATLEAARAAEERRIIGLERSRLGL
jgi:superfamily II DNA or RNA helicase